MKKELKIGIIVVLILAFAYWGFTFLKGFDLFSKEAIYHAKYDNIQGLEVSNPVKYHGLKVGQVSAIELAKGNAGGPGAIVVTFVISNKDIKITDKTIARIISSDLLGSRAINLEHLDSGNVVDPGTFVMGGIEKDLQAQVAEEILPLKQSAQKLIESVEQLVGSFKAVMNEDTKNNLIEAFATIPNTIKNLQNAANTIDTTIEGSTDKIHAILSNVLSISTNLKESNSKIQSIINNLDVMTDSLAKANVTQTIALVNETMRKTNDILEKINSGKGTVGKLINDEKLYNELILTDARLNLLIMDIQENPQRYINLSLVDFRGHKDKFKPDSAYIRQIIEHDTTLYKQMCPPK
ncbi:MAG: MlaD family protein [Flavobacteriales bacterium]